MIARRNALALLTLSLSGLLLTGCAAGASASDSAVDATAAAETPATGQTLEEACGTLQASLTDASTAMQEGMSSFSSDPAAAVASLQTFAGEFEAARSAVEVAELKAEADAAGAALDEMIVALEAGVTDPASIDLVGFTAKAQAVQGGFLAIGEVCAG